MVQRWYDVGTTLVQRWYDVFGLKPPSGTPLSMAITVERSELKLCQMFTVVFEGLIDLQANGWQERCLKDKAKTKNAIRLDQQHEERRRMSGSQNPFAYTEIAGQRPL